MNIEDYRNIFSGVSEEYMDSCQLQRQDDFNLAIRILDDENLDPISKAMTQISWVMWWTGIGTKPTIPNLSRIA